MRVVNDWEEMPAYLGGPEYFLGLSLGQQAKDYTSLAILERHGEGTQAIFHARHLYRFPLGSSYPSISASLGEVFKRPELGKRPMLAVDATGAGTEPVNYLKQAKLNASLWPVTITGGDSEVFDSGVHRLPRRDLVGLLQMALQTDRLRIATTLPEAAALMTELHNFKTRVTEHGNESFDAWRVGAKDDLVLAVALALWVGRKRVESWRYVGWR